MAAGLGAAGCLVAVGLAAARVGLHRLAGDQRAAWWIAAGCGGLSAAGLGRVSAVGPARGGLAARHTFGSAALVLWAVGAVALVPVLGGSVAHLAKTRHVSGRPWPPSFSTGVFALGAGQVGHLMGVAVITQSGSVAAVVTICLWVLTVAAHLPRVARHLSRQPPGLTT